MTKFQPALAELRTERRYEQITNTRSLVPKLSLIKGEAHLLEKYYNKLNEQHTISDSITKIFIPVHPIDVLKEQVMLENVRVKAIHHLQKDTKTKTSASF